MVWHSEGFGGVLGVLGAIGAPMIERSDREKINGVGPNGDATHHDYFTPKLRTFPDSKFLNTLAFLRMCL